jgi:hypothetical protein
MPMLREQQVHVSLAPMSNVCELTQEKVWFCRASGLPQIGQANNPLRAPATA